MVARAKILLECCGLSMALVFMPLIPEAISQESQRSGTPLKDVCRDGWARYYCEGGGVRVCVSPEVESHYDLASSSHWSTQSCSKSPTQSLVPDAWAHVPPELIGYLSATSEWAGYRFVMRVVNFDSSAIRNGDLEKAIDNLPLYQRGDSDSWNEGIARHRPHAAYPLDSYGIDLPAPKISVKDACPTTYSRFGCQFVRLCVSPSVAAKYDLTSSEEFGYAKCKVDNRIVPESDTYCSPKQDTHCSPHDVGMAAGMLILGPRYLKAVKLDSSDIFDGNIEEAIQRLVLVPIPTSGLMEYDRGYDEGQAAFQKYLSENGQKDAKSPH
jgi:hypothetical protein